MEAELEEHLTINGLTLEEWPYQSNSAVWIGDIGRVSGLLGACQLSSCNAESSSQNYYLTSFYLSYSSYERRKAIYWSLMSFFWTLVWGNNTHIFILSMLYYFPLWKEVLVLSDLCRLMAIFLYFPIPFANLLFLNCGQSNYIRIYTSVSINSSENLFSME